MNGLCEGEGSALQLLRGKQIKLYIASSHRKPTNSWRSEKEISVLTSLSAGYPLQLFARFRQRRAALAQLLQTLHLLIQAERCQFSSALLAHSRIWVSELLQSRARSSLSTVMATSTCSTAPNPANLPWNSSSGVQENATYDLPVYFLRIPICPVASLGRADNIY